MQLGVCGDDEARGWKWGACSVLPSPVLPYPINSPNCNGTCEWSPNAAARDGGQLGVVGSPG
jgi:hypothetical protein